MVRYTLLGNLMPKEFIKSLPVYVCDTFYEILHFSRGKNTILALKLLRTPFRFVMGLILVCIGPLYMGK